jgi:IclR family pca regulon transcriptional regulator
MDDGPDGESAMDATLNVVADREILGGFLKGLSVIQAFDRDREAMTIADVAKATGFDRATARRCLLTLTRLGYAETDGRRFRLTARILRLGFAYLSTAPLPRLVQPFLERLSEATGESCSASVLDGDEIVYVARASQRRVLSISLSVGSRLPAYCSSMGRSMLSALPVVEARALLVGSQRRKLTPATVTDLSELLAILDGVRVADYALVDQELEVGLRSIAVPLRDGSGKTIGAVNVGLHAARMSCNALEQTVLPRLREVQGEVARST